MAEDLRINGEIFRGVKYITIRNLQNEDIKYYKEGVGGGGSGENINFRTAELEEIQAILDLTSNFQQTITENSRYRAATAEEINDIF